MQDDAEYVPEVIVLSMKPVNPFGTREAELPLYIVQQKGRLSHRSPEAAQSARTWCPTLAERDCSRSTERDVGHVAA